jgi:hypothetical protein
VVRDAEPVMQPHRRYAVANLCICACQPKREGAMTSEALFGLSILMNLVAWGIVALLFIWPRTGHRSLEMLKTYSRDAEAFVGHAGAGLL